MNDSGREDRDFETHVAGRLRESAQKLDASTKSRLNRARQAALAELGVSRPAAWSPAWSAAGLAAVALLAFGLWRGPWAPLPEQTPATAQTPSAPDLEILMADESLDMLEDLEFFAWLAAEPLRPVAEAAG